MLDRGQASCSEEWYANGTWRSGRWQGIMRTLSHAWSACPAEFLITGLAGIEIIEPGCRRLGISPLAADFPYRVAFPTPLGEVNVGWDGSAAEVAAPEGVSVVRD